VRKENSLLTLIKEEKELDKLPQRTQEKMVSFTHLVGLRLISPRVW